MLKNQRGITLVALVITIIILIILATVAISFAFGSNGLINRAQDAKKYYLALERLAGKKAVDSLILSQYALKNQLINTESLNK